MGMAGQFKSGTHENIVLVLLTDQADQTIGFGHFSFAAISGFHKHGSFAQMDLPISKAEVRIMERSFWG